MSAPFVEERQDQQRGCGWRKPGGYYLVAGGEGAPCCKLPVPLDQCPTCNAGIKFCRGWQWLDLAKFVSGPAGVSNDLISPAACTRAGTADCPLVQPHLLGRIGLLWVGQQFYKTPADFNAEAAKLGISRRIKAVPREFVLGKTWVGFAHVRACQGPIPIPEQMAPAWNVLKVPGLFRLFKPEAIEYVTTGAETEPELQAIVDRGITPVKVIRTTAQPDLPAEDEPEA
jgi:hypothetical protein